MLQCASIPAMYHLIQLTDPSQPTKLMILGPACSGASELMGGIAEKYLNIPQVGIIYNISSLYCTNNSCLMIFQVAYTVASSLFGEDKDHYPRFYRLVPIAKQVVNAYVALVKKLNWKRVLIISYDNDFYIDVSTKLSSA